MDTELEFLKKLKTELDSADYGEGYDVNLPAISSMLRERILEMSRPSVVHVVKIKDIDFKNMPNNEEFYFVTDLVGNKKVHRCGHIKAHLNNFSSVILETSQLK